MKLLNYQLTVVGTTRVERDGLWPSSGDYAEGPAIVSVTTEIAPIVLQPRTPCRHPAPRRKW